MENRLSTVIILILCLLNYVNIARAMDHTRAESSIVSDSTNKQQISTLDEREKAEAHAALGSLIPEDLRQDSSVAGTDPLIHRNNYPFSTSVTLAIAETMYQNAQYERDSEIATHLFINAAKLYLSVDDKIGARGCISHAIETYVAIEDPCDRQLAKKLKDLTLALIKMEATHREG